MYFIEKIEKLKKEIKKMKIKMDKIDEKKSIFDAKLKKK